jgi:hypothetical protein
MPSAAPTKATVRPSSKAKCSWVEAHRPTRSPTRALHEVGARNIRVHEVELKKSLRDIPLAEIRPDPWLGDEKLASP